MSRDLTTKFTVSNVNGVWTYSSGAETVTYTLVLGSRPSWWRRLLRLWR